MVCVVEECRCTTNPIFVLRVSGCFRFCGWNMFYQVVMLWQIMFYNVRERTRQQPLGCYRHEIRVPPEARMLVRIRICSTVQYACSVDGGNLCHKVMRTVVCISVVCCESGVRGGRGLSAEKRFQGRYGINNNSGRRERCVA